MTIVKFAFNKFTMGGRKIIYCLERHCYKVTMVTDTRFLYFNNAAVQYGFYCATDVINSLSYIYIGHYVAIFILNKELGLCFFGLVITDTIDAFRFASSKCIDPY